MAQLVKIQLKTIVHYREKQSGTSSSQDTMRYYKEDTVSKHINDFVMDPNGHMAKFINDKRTGIQLSDNSDEK